MQRASAFAILVLPLLAGCAMPDDGADGTATATPSISAGPQGTSSTSATGEADAAPWASMPVLGPWRREGCDAQREAVPSGNAPPPAPFDGTLGDLVAALEAGFDVDVDAVNVGEEQAHAYVEGANGTDVFTISRLGGPAFDARLNRVWPGTTMHQAWQGLNATLDAMGLPRPDRTEYALQRPSGVYAEFRWPAGSTLRSAGLDVAGDGPSAPLTRFNLAPAPPAWPTGARDNASLEQAGQAFLACELGPGYQPSHGVVGAWHASVGRWMTFRLPTAGHHCGGPSHEVVVDVVTQVVLRHWPGQPCI